MDNYHCQLKCYLFNSQIKIHHSFSSIPGSLCFFVSYASADSLLISINCEFFIFTIEIWTGGMGFAISLRQEIDADKDVSLRCLQITEKRLFST